MQRIAISAVVAALLFLYGRVGESQPEPGAEPSADTVTASRAAEPPEKPGETEGEEPVLEEPEEDAGQGHELVREAASTALPDRVQKQSRPAKGSKDFENAPPPEAAHGVEVERETPNRWWLWPPRALLFVPRWALEIPFAVPRLTLWAYDRYQFRARFIRYFFNDSETIGLFPALFFETGFGFNGGVRFIHRDLFGENGKLKMRAGFGGVERQVYIAEMRTGSLFGGFEVKASAKYSLSPKARFFGIGNADLGDPEAMPVNPLVADTAVDTRYRTSGTLLKLAAIANLTGELSTSASGAFKARSFEDADWKDDINTSSAYDATRLVGYMEGLSNLYGELDVTYDSRRSTRHYLSTATPAIGWRLSGFAGYQAGIGDDPSGFFRWGADLQRNIDLYGGSRYLVVRLFSDNVVGELDRVPFVDLPDLGGPLILRGYERGRFRDRHAMLATIEYNYPVIRHMSGYLFVDAGRVWRRLEDVELKDGRFGYGVGLQVDTRHHFLARAFVASSTDGGVFISVSFDPVFDARSRKDRP